MKMCRMIWMPVLMTTFYFNCTNDKKPAKMTRNIQTAEPLRYVRIYSDANGESHFADEEMSFQLVDFAPPAPPISVSELFNPAGETFIISSPPGWYGDWHPAPRRQLLFALSGKLEVEVSDGETRIIGPGCIVVVEDTTGRGHISHVIGSERCYMAVVPLEDEE